MRNLFEEQNKIYKYIKEKDTFNLEVFLLTRSWYYKKLKISEIIEIELKDIEGFLNEFYSKNYFHLFKYCENSGKYLYRSEEKKCSCIIDIKKIYNDYLEIYKNNSFKNISFNSFIAIISCLNKANCFEYIKEKTKLSDSHIYDILKKLSKLGFLVVKSIPEDRRIKSYVLKIKRKTNNFLLISKKIFISKFEYLFLKEIKYKTFKNPFLFSFGYFSKKFKISKWKVYKTFKKLISKKLLEKLKKDNSNYKEKISSSFYLKQKYFLK